MLSEEVSDNTHRAEGIGKGFWKYMGIARSKYLSIMLEIYLKGGNDVIRWMLLSVELRCSIVMSMMFQRNKTLA